MPFTWVREIWIEFLSELGFKPVDQCVICSIWERDPPHIPVQLNSHSLWFLLNWNRLVGRVRCPIVTSMQAHGPNAMLRTEWKPLLPLHTIIRHPECPLSAVAYLHVPAVAACPQGLRPEHTLVVAEALGVIRYLLLFICVAQDSEVVR